MLWKMITRSSNAPFLWSELFVCSVLHSETYAVERSRVQAVDGFRVGCTRHLSSNGRQHGDSRWYLLPEGFFLFENVSSGSIYANMSFSMFFAPLHCTIMRTQKTRFSFLKRFGSDNIILMWSGKKTFPDTNFQHSFMKKPHSLPADCLSLQYFATSTMWILLPIFIIWRSQAAA